MAELTDGCAPAVILDLGPSGLEVCRALGRRGISVFGADRRLGIAARSRYCRASLAIDPRDCPEKARQSLIELAREQTARPVLMALSNEWLMFVSRHRAPLDEHYRLLLPPTEVVDSLTDKLRAYELARSHDIEVPKHDVVESEQDLRRAAAHTGYPCVLKPTHSSDWAQPEARSAMGARKIACAHDARSLALAYEQARPFAARHVLEELVPGPDTNHYYAVCYVDRNAVVRAQFVHRKILMRPPGRGIGCLIESVREEHLANASSEFLRAVGHMGIAGLEFKRDARDGRWKLLDLNPRWGQGDSLAAICGPDMAWLYYRDSQGADLEDAGDYRPGVKWVQLRSYLRSAAMARRESGLGLVRSMLRLRGELHHSVLAWDDLGPAAWTLGQLLARMAPGRPRNPQPAPAPEEKRERVPSEADRNRSDGR